MVEQEGGGQWWRDLKKKSSPRLASFLDNGKDAERRLER